MNTLIDELKQLIINALDLEDVTPADIDPHAPLFGDGLGLDSIDALELVLGIEQHFGVKIEDEAAGLQAFKNVESLTAYIAEHRAA